MLKHKQSIYLVLVDLFIVLFPLGSVLADSSISYSYKSISSLSSGDIVSLIAKKSDYIEAANTSNTSNLLGVVSSAKGSVLEVDPSSSTVQVATGGTVPVLVSTLNGVIAPGSLLSVSPLSGIGMKTDNKAALVGIAQTSFNSSSANATKEQVKTSNGQVRAIAVGYVLATIKIGSANQSPKQPLNGLQQFIKDLTGRTVSLVRIIISLVISILAIVILGMIIYSSVFGSIIAVGRNPLAKASIMRTLVGVIVMALALATITVIVVNLLLN